ncbi:MAG TPA: YncE family protein [Gemmatimonadales bacterium]|nr:YncE family protein [Gemmatimonadales bacterium]
MRRFALAALLCALAPAGLAAQDSTARPDTGALPGMPPVADTGNLYADAGAGMLSAAARRDTPLVYVPLGGEASVAVIDPHTYKVVRRFETGALPQHVVPSYDFSTLWVANDLGSSLTPIDPVTGKAEKNVTVPDPYNLYFTPDGKDAIVVAERLDRLDFRDPHSMRLLDSVPVHCPGVDHMDFTRDGRYLVATCEFSGQLVKVDVLTHKVVGHLTLDPKGLGVHGMPQDIRSAPDGRVFFVADMRADGVYVVDPVTFKRVGFVAAGIGTHGIYPSRDGRLFYITSRGWHTTHGGPHGPGSIVVLDPVTEKVVATWPIPGGGSPDMGNVSADGTELWVSGRYDREVYVFDTRTGTLAHRIPVGRDPHGLCVWPQPGRYSLGHTGNMR